MQGVRVGGGGGGGGGERILIAGSAYQNAGYPSLHVRLYVWKA